MDFGVTVPRMYAVVIGESRRWIGEAELRGVVLEKSALNSLCDLGRIRGRGVRGVTKLRRVTNVTRFHR